MGVIWSSEIIDEAIQRVELGEKIKDSPFFDNDVKLKKADLSFEYSENELIEFLKITKNKVYFGEHYCEFKDENGNRNNVRLRDYQRETLGDLANPALRYHILMWSRQCAKTTTIALDILHYCLTNENKNVMITANMGATVVEIIDKIKEFYMSMPFWLKIGIKKWNEKSIVFDNGCRILTSKRSKTPAIGFTIDYLYIDEFAHIPANYITPYYRAVIPIISSLKNSKLVISSTPNGYNMFHKLVTEAQLPKNHPDFNGFNLRIVYWWQVAGRGEEWKREQTKLINGEENFNQEFNLHFDSGSNNLFKGEVMRNIKENSKEYEFIKIPVLDKYLEFGYDNLKFVKDEEIFEIEKVKKYYILYTLDPSEGLEGDYTAMNIFKVTLKDFDMLKKIKDKNITKFFKLTQIATYSINTLHPEKIAEVVYLISHHVFNPERVKGVIEINKYGDTIISKMPHVFQNINQYQSSTVMRFKHTKDDVTPKLGMKITTLSKKENISKFKNIIEDESLIISDIGTISELAKFTKKEGRDGSYTFKAESGHDDLIMCTINLAGIYDSFDFLSYCYEILESYDNETQNIINTILIGDENEETFGTEDVFDGLDITNIMNEYKDLRIEDNSSDYLL